MVQPAQLCFVELFWVRSHQAVSFLWQGWNPTVQDPKAAPQGDAGERPGQRASASTSHSRKFHRTALTLLSEFEAHQSSQTHVHLFFSF